MMVSKRSRNGEIEKLEWMGKIEINLNKYEIGSQSIR
jgi:hypothetical protein